MEREYKCVNTIDDGVKTVSAHFFAKMIQPRLDKKVAKASKPRKRIKVTNAAVQVPGKVTKKEQARKYFVEGYAANEVAALMEITYANAHYYLRAFRKDGGDIGQEIK